MYKISNNLLRFRSAEPQILTQSRERRLWNSYLPLVFSPGMTDRNCELRVKKHCFVPQPIYTLC